MSKPKAAASVSPDAGKLASPCNRRGRVSSLTSRSRLGLAHALGGWMGLGLANCGPAPSSATAGATVAISRVEEYLLLYDLIDQLYDSLQICRHRCECRKSPAIEAHWITKVIPVTMSSIERHTPLRGQSVNVQALAHRFKP